MKRAYLGRMQTLWLLVQMWAPMRQASSFSGFPAMLLTPPPTISYNPYSLSSVGLPELHPMFDVGSLNLPPSIPRWRLPTHNWGSHQSRSQGMASSGHASASATARLLSWGHPYRLLAFSPASGFTGLCKSTLSSYLSQCSSLLLTPNPIPQAPHVHRLPVQPRDRLYFLFQGRSMYSSSAT